MTSVVEAAGNFAHRFSRLTDVEMNRIVYDSGIRYIAATACSVDDTNHAQLEEWDRQGKVRLMLAASETILPAFAAGVYVGSGGRERTLMKLQISGYGHILDGLVSSLETFGIPAAVCTTLRGIEPEDISIPHRNMGRITDPLTRLWFPKEGVFGRLDGKRLRGELTRGMARFAEGKNTMVRVSPAGFEKTIQPPEVGPREYTTEGLREHLEALDLVRHRLYEVWGQTPISREEADDKVMDSITEDTVVVTGNGYEPRALFSRHHRALNIYGIGNMGGAKAFGIGIKLANPFLPVRVIEGDMNAQEGCAALYSLARYRFSEDDFRSEVYDNGHGSSVGTAESLPLLLDDHRFSRVTRTIPEQSGQFKEGRVEDEISNRYATDREMIETLGPMVYQINTAMHVIRQETAKKIARLIDQHQLEEADIPPTFADYRQYAA